MFDPAKFPILIDGSVILISKLYIILYYILYVIHSYSIHFFYFTYVLFLMYLCYGFIRYKTENGQKLEPIEEITIEVIIQFAIHNMLVQEYVLLTS